FLATPAESRKAWASNPSVSRGIFLDFFVAVIHDCFHTSTWEGVLCYNRPSHRFFLRPQEIYCQRFLLRSLILFGRYFLPYLFFNYLSNNLQRARSSQNHTDVVSKPWCNRICRKAEMESPNRLSPQFSRTSTV